MPKSDDEEMHDNHSEEDSDKDSDSDESSSDDEQQTIVVDDGLIDRLEVKLMSEPYNYENHVAFISALRQSGKLDKLREARENLNKLFPLLEEQWLEWLEDDQRFATSDDEKAQLVSLYQRALKEYQSANIWLSYCNYIRETYAPAYMLTSLDAGNLKRVRNTYEEALTSVGIHVQEGSKIWNSFREFEQSLLDALTESKSDISKQTDIVRSLFKRQLSVPLMNMQDTWNTYKSWETGKSQDFEPLFQRALEMLNERLPFEQKLLTIRNTPLNPDYKKYDRWRLYLDFEEEKGDPSRIMNLYERAIKSFFLMLEEKVFKASSSMVINVHERAVRNVPFSGALWVSYMRALERAQQPLEAIFEQSLVSGLSTAEDYASVFQAYINYTKRQCSSKITSEQGEKLRSVLNRANEYMSQYFGENGATMSIQHYWGGIEARVFHNVENSRKILGELVKHSHSYDHWIQYINIERYFGDAQNARNLFKKAYLAVHDYTEKMWDDWLFFEEENGTFEQYDFALEKISGKRREIEVQRAKEAEKAAKEMAASSSKKEQRKDKKMKRKGEDRPSDVKRQKVYEKEEEGVKDETMGEATSTSEPRTAFVVNLEYNMKEPELKDIFTKFGNVVDVRLIKDKNGNSKGFAYIEFDTEESAQASLALNGTQLKGRTLKVTISTPPDKNKLRKKTAAEANSEVNPLAVYISGIPTGVNEDKLKELFSKCGTIKEVRLVKDKVTGQLKGFAFIDFETPEAAEAALKMDQTQMYGKPIRVHKSMSTLKKTEETTPAPEPEPEFKMPTARLMPRSMRVQTKPGSGTGAGGPPKSNAEFRKLLNR